MLKNISCHQIIMKQDKGSQIKKKKGFTLLKSSLSLCQSWAFMGSSLDSFHQKCHE